MLAGDHKRARLLLEEAVRTGPVSVDTINALASLLRDAGELESALALFERPLKFAQGTGRVAQLRNCAIVLRELGRFDEAVSRLDEARSIDPENSDVSLDRALIDIDCGRWESARRQVDTVLARQPDNARAHLMRALDLLADGHFDRGWAAYEWRLGIQGWEIGNTRWLPRWDPVAHPTDTVLVIAEQGLGDQIMFCSCIPDLIESGARCVIACEARLVALFQRSFTPARVMDIAALTRHDGATPDLHEARSCVPMGSLPGFYRKSIDRFAQSGRYIRTDRSRVDYWRGRLDTLGRGPKIGLSWRGGTAASHRNLRSIDPALLLDVLGEMDVVAVSLQYGNCHADLQRMSTTRQRQVHHWDAPLRDYDETAALVDALDLVVTVCTSIVHLSGAIGKTCWVLVPAVPEWRYMRNGERMPWYSSVTLFRQTTPGDWSGAIASMRDQLLRSPFSND